MNSDYSHLWPLVPKHCPIPAEFHSLELDGPFQKCLICHTELVSCGQYFVERVFRGTEPILEYAICGPCQTEMTSELSRDSLARMEEFFASIDTESRVNRLRGLLPATGEYEGLDDWDSDSKISDVEPWFAECLVTKKKRSQCRGYQLIGSFSGNQLELGHAPFMLSSDVTEELSSLMSKTTRDRMGDFIGTYFGMPPEFQDNPSFWPALV